MIKLIGDIGFCYGVKNAIDVLKKASTENNTVYLTHPLLHNKKENDDLLLKNHARVYQEGDRLTESAIVFSAHGHDPKEEGKFPGARLYDATCPLIKKRYDLLATKRGVTTLFLGKKGHQETEGFLGRFPDFLFIDVKKDIPKQLLALGLVGKKTALVPQTTISRKSYALCHQWLEKNTDLLFSLPICPIYEKRYLDIQKHFRENDPSKSYLVICGDTLSSNANELLMSALMEFEGLQGTIAMRLADIPDDILGKKDIVLASSTSASEKSVLQLWRALQEKEDKLSDQ